MYAGIDVIPIIPLDLDEFFIEPPLMEPPPLEVLDNPPQYGFDEWLNLEQHPWRIFEYDPEGKLLGFGDDGKSVFRAIAHHLRSFHLSSVFCGDVFGRVRIDANNLTISFPYRPVEPFDYNHLCRGIENDILHFRYMVAKTMKSELMASENQLVPLTIDFPLFFSKIYTSGIANEDLDIVKEMGFFQIFHPLFFDSVDRNNFIHLVLEYQNRNFPAFISRLTLDDSRYKLRGWTKTIPHDSDFHWMVDIASKYSGKYYFSIIPRLMRNARHHFSEKNKETFHEDVDEKLNQQFPGICAKLQDAMLRSVNTPEDFLNCKMGELFEKKPFGFYTRPYRL